MIKLAIKAPIGMEYDGQEYTIKCMDPGVTFAVDLFTMERISPWRDVARPYQIPEGSTAKLRVTRPDRAYTLTKTIIEGGTILCPVHPYSVATPGKCSADVVVYGSDGNRITSATFHFFVDRECAPTSGEDMPVYVDSIQGLIEFVEQSVERAEKAAERAENAGVGGDDGGYYSPEITPNEADNSFTITFKASKEGMPDVAPATIKLPEKNNGSGENPAIDTTLTQSGQAADAKAVGDEIKRVEARIPNTLPNPKKLTFTGGATGEYDGSSDLTISIPTRGEVGNVREAVEEVIRSMGRLVATDDGTGIITFSVVPWPDDEPDTAPITSVLGQAILGQMLLGG